MFDFNVWKSEPSTKPRSRLFKLLIMSNFKETFCRRTLVVSLCHRTTSTGRRKLASFKQSYESVSHTVSTVMSQRRLRQASLLQLHLKVGLCYSMQDALTWLDFTPCPPAPLGLLSALLCSSLRCSHTQDQSPTDGDRGQHEAQWTSFMKPAY